LRNITKNFNELFFPGRKTNQFFHFLLKKITSEVSAAQRRKINPSPQKTSLSQTHGDSPTRAQPLRTGIRSFFPKTPRWFGGIGILMLSKSAIPGIFLIKRALKVWLSERG
jgi:hypothetical protein